MNIRRKNYSGKNIRSENKKSDSSRGELTEHPRAKTFTFFILLDHGKSDIIRHLWFPASRVVPYFIYYFVLYRHSVCVIQ